MLREYTNELKNYNFLQKITEGYYVDAKDQGRWKVGRVQQIRKIGHKHCVQIMFDGYSYKYNETYDIPSFTKLAPFRKFSLPYTGRSNDEPKREQPSKSLQHYLKVMNKLLTDPQFMKSQFINQFIRGELFIFVDYALTPSIRQQPKYSFDDYMRIFDAYLDFFGNVLDKVLEFLKEIQKDKEGAFVLDQNYAYVHPKVALLYSVTEFLFNCNSMVSKRVDRVTFHQYFGKHQPAEQIYLAFKQKMKSLKLYEKCQKLLSYRLLNNTRSLPWSIKKQALILLKSLNPQQPIPLPKETKQIIEFLEYLPYMTFKQVLSSEDKDKVRIQLIFTLLLSGNFEGKLFGLNEIKKLLSYTGYSTKNDAVIFQYVRDKNLVGYFLDNNNFNSELFKRAIVVFQYAYKHKLFTKEHFSQVFKLHKDKHQLQLKNFYNSLSQFGIFLSFGDCVQFFQAMISSLPFQQPLIQLIKTFTISTIDKNESFRKIYMTKDQQGLGLIYYWQQINNQTKVTAPFIPKMIECFAQLLNNVYYNKQTQRFIVSSIKAIKEMKNPESFLKVIHQSLKMCKGTRMNRIIETAEREVNCIEAAMTMLRKAEIQLSKTGFENLFEFLQEVNFISRKGLSPGDIIFMWKMDKERCRPHLLKFLSKFKLTSSEYKSQQRVINKSLDMGQIQYIIRNIFENDQLMEGYRQIDEANYQTIDELILCYLHNKRIIEYNYKHTIRFRKNEIFLDDNSFFLGMSFYLKCIENNKKQNEAVTIKAIKRFIEIFLRPHKDDFSPKSIVDIKVKNWLKVSSFFDKIKSNKLQCFQILMQEIYGRMKSLNILEPDITQIKVQIHNTNKTHTFAVPMYTSLWKFRLLINQKFQLDNTDFSIELIEQRSITDIYKEEDFSCAFITTAKEKNGVSVMVRLSKDQHPHFRAIDKFKQEFCDIYGQNFYKYLSSSNTNVSGPSLQILAQLPFLKSLQKSITSLDFKQWSQLLDHSNMKKLQYQLKIITKVKDLKWIINFLAKNGTKHLTYIVSQNVGKDNYKTLNMLMGFFMEAVKFTNKSPLPFNEQFLKDILVYEKDKKNNEDYLLFLTNCFALIKQVSTKMKISTLFEKQKMTQIIEIVLFSNKQSKISQHLIEICKNASLYQSLNKHLRQFVNFKYLSQRQYECKNFFEVVRNLIERGQLQIISEPLEQLLLEIRGSDIMEKSQNQTNDLLYGYLVCLYEFVKVKNDFENILAESKEHFFMYLLNECLFHLQNISLRKFKSKQSKQLGFKFLEMLGFQTKRGNEINNMLIPMMARGAWRKQFDWSILPVEFVNKKFTGLKNLAATCYINSLLQQLFYIKNFSSQLMSVDSDLIEDKQNIVREIQNIFGFLKYSQNPSYTTTSLCQNFILDGQPIDPRIQMDVDEFFHALMDKLQRNLAKLNKKDIINEVFRGQFSNMIIGQQCPHASQRIEEFLSIRLEIKNKKTIYQALDQFIKGEILEGENSYFCQKCDKKVKALKRVCLKDLPDVMIVTLKRFEFDYDTMQKFKLNTYCSFPENINFLPYTKEGLQEDSDAKKEDYEYKLKGVVIHYGISQAGHYTSYVRTDEKNWNYFDDEKISQFDLGNIEKECFGGIEQNPFGDDEERKKNAYLLIYEKVKPCSELKLVPQTALTQTKVHALVEEDNTKSKLINLLFEPNIESYIFNSSQINPTAFILYYHTVFLRSYNKRQKYVEFYQKCSELLKKKQVAEWYLKQLTQAVILELVVHSEPQVRIVVTSLICQAMRVAVDLEFMQQCVAMLYVKNVLPFAKLFAQACLAHPEYTKFLGSINFGQLVLNLIKGKDIRQTNIMKKLQTRKIVSQFGTPVSSFIQRKSYDLKDYLQAIQSMKANITLEQVAQLGKMINNKRTLRSLAMVTARKHKDPQDMKKFMDQFLVPQLFKFQPKTGEETYYELLIMLVEELCKINDKDQEQRNKTLVSMFIMLMKQSMIGYKSELMLFNGLFRMVLTNKVFKNALFNLVNDKQFKKLITSFKDWLKELPNVIQNIRTEKWGWWRRPKKSYAGLTARDIQNDIKPNVKQALSLLNSIIEKHTIDEVPQSLQVNNFGYIEQKYNAQEVKITRKIGFLVEVKNQQGEHRFINEDDVTKKYV